jgi:acetolactate synthase-1/2/3 large subunit
MKVTEFLVKSLSRENIDTVFMVPGALIDAFLPEFGNKSPVKAVVASHEAGAAFMADGYGRAKGSFGVCMVIGGPGTANIVGPLAAAYSDRAPVLAIAGEVASDIEGRGSFQDASPSGLNDIELVRPITSYAAEIPSVKSIKHHLHNALRTMLSMTTRPVFLSIPAQIQTSEVDDDFTPVSEGLSEPPRIIDTKSLQSLAETMAKATNIAILAGDGASRSEATDALIKLAETYKIPVATTLRAKGVFPEDHPLSLGVFGYGGTRHSTEALLGSDLDVLIVLGSSLSQRDTMLWSKRLKPRQCMVQVDVDITAFDRYYPIDMSIVGDVRTVVEWLSAEKGKLPDSLAKTEAERHKWFSEILALERIYNLDTRIDESSPMHPARVISEMRKVAPRNTVAVIDSGAHRAFAAEHWTSYAPGQYLSSTTVAPMGWAIPAAIGAKVARPDMPCAVITGDGCMGMHGIEIQTAAHQGLHIIYLVINNSALGNVYLRAKETESGANLTSLTTHDWAGFSRSLGGDGITVEKPEDLASAFEKAFAADGPFVIDARCGRDFTTPIGPWNEAKKENRDWLVDH